MAFDENNYETTPTDGEDLPEESNNNRTFMIAVGILGGLILISVACLGGVYLFGRGGSGTAPADQELAAQATQTALSAQSFINQALTATFQAAILPTATLSPTPTSTPPVSLPSPTNTPDPAIATALGGGVGTQAAATSTVAAALTQAAAAQKTVAVLPSQTPSSLAKGGIADEYGLPGLVVMALAFIIVILFARRLRVSPTR